MSVEFTCDAPGIVSIHASSTGGVWRKQRLVTTYTGDNLFLKLRHFDGEVTERIAEGYHLSHTLVIGSVECRPGEDAQTVIVGMISDISVDGLPFAGRDIMILDENGNPVKWPHFDEEIHEEKYRYMMVDWFGDVWQLVLDPRQYPDQARIRFAIGNAVTDVYEVPIGLFVDDFEIEAHSR